MISYIDRVFLFYVNMPIVDLHKNFHIQHENANLIFDNDQHKTVNADCESVAIWMLDYTIVNHEATKYNVYFEMKEYWSTCKIS